MSLLQPVKGYRAGIDPVLLAASVPAKTGDSVLDLGCGGGVAMICLATRVTGVTVTGVEVQPGYAALAQSNLERNAVDGQAFCAGIEALPADLRQMQFDHVIANPPYFDPDARTAKSRGDAELARAEDVPLAKWVEVASRRLRADGTATFVFTADRLPPLLCAFDQFLGSVELWPIHSRPGRAARLVLVRGRKGGRAAFRCHAPLVLHEGDRHEKDGDSYTKRVSSVLRDGEELPFPTQKR